jgi:6-phospho-beta-glucosidase
MAPELAATAAQLGRSCPTAAILNLTNPLSVSTALLHEHGLTSTVGLCELPQATLAEACRVLDVAGDQVTWSYTGLNHRGFLHDVMLDGRDLLAELTGRLGRDTIGGITSATIAELEAIPLKYFLLFIAPPPLRSSRATYLARLREQAIQELAADELHSPPSLAGRSQPWYSDSVVPAMAGIRGAVPIELAVSAVAPDGLAWERRCLLGREGPVFAPDRPAPTAVRQWNDQFAEHERCVLAAVRAPSRARLRAALAADPLLPADRLDQAVDAVRSTIDR